ncbi:MAG: NAD(P)-dependent oxidoreductase [Pseudomonadota bacterium]|nr:NAD(P)-dependent oxidoreductase [Pseudomonadota bacterium]
MKILVTGSSGFVGKALLQALIAAGHDARGLSRGERPDAFQGDLLDPASLRRALDAFQPRVVFNMAAETDLKGVARNGYRANTEGVSHLIEAVAATPSVERVIWSSSQLVCRPGAPPAGDTDYDPVGGYGESKAEGERRVRAADGGGKAWVIVRSTTIWGPGMSAYYTGMFHLIRRGLYFHVGRAPLRKSYSYIENLTDQLATLATAPAPAVHGRTFYLADSEPVELRTWADGFAEAFGRRIPTLPLPLARGLALAGDLAARLGLPAPLTTSRLKNMLTQYIYDTAPIEAVHGPTRISNAEGVRRTAAWFLTETAA